MKVLVVDDRAEERTLAEATLRGGGYEVTVASDGLDALAKLRQARVDLILSDVLMPGMDGYQLCRTVKTSDKLAAVPFVFYTATYTEPRDQELGRAAGAARYIVKPVEPEKLLAILDEILHETQRPRPPQPAPEEFLEQYNARLVHRLEEKLVESKALTQRLRDEEQRYKNLFEHSVLGMYRLAPDGRLLAMNHALARMLGRDSPAELIDERVGAGALSSEPWRTLAAALGAASEAAVEFEVEVARADGGAVSLSVSAQRLSDGTVEGSVKDVTSRRRAEEAAREASERTREILEHADDCIFSVQLRDDGAMVLDSFNPACARATGVAAKDAIGRTPQEVLPAAITAPLIADLDRVVATRAVRRWERTITSASGQRTWDVQGIPAPDASGRVRRIIVFARDITERRALEEQLLTAQKMEAVGRLAGGIAHDFNNLLTVIISAGELAARQSGQAPSEELAEVLVAAERGATLTRQLLTFGRRQSTSFKVVDLCSVVTSFEKLVRRVIGEDIRLSVRLASEPILVWADAPQLEQVLMNLAVNARDAMPDGGQLRVEVSSTSLDDAQAAARQLARGSYALLTISDSGVGIPEHVLPHVFEPFFTTKEVGRGTGLGLSTAYSIVTQSRGAIFVASTPGKGTTFSIYLPLRSSAVTPEEVPGPTPVRRAAAARVVLVVEDEEALRRLIVRVLRNAGYSVHEAADGEEALRRASALDPAPDLLLTDVVMPKMSGPILAQRLREQRGDLRVLFTSGYPARPDDPMADTSQMRILPKPFTTRALLDAVGDALAAPTPTHGTPAP